MLGSVNNLVRRMATDNYRHRSWLGYWQGQLEEVPVAPKVAVEDQVLTDGTGCSAAAYFCK